MQKYFFFHLLVAEISLFKKALPCDRIQAKQAGRQGQKQARLGQKQAVLGQKQSFWRNLTVVPTNLGNPDLWLSIYLPRPIGGGGIFLGICYFFP